jgi:transcriptional regulator of arginine metabolism
MHTQEGRRAAVREILEAAEIRSQAELLAHLERRGLTATQPVLSRDLRALHVSKRDGVYRLSERVTPLDALASLLRDARIAGDNLVVIVCEPGAASAIARALEMEGSEGLVGTVAGDDSVFAAVAKRRAGQRIRERVLALIAS